MVSRSLCVIFEGIKCLRFVCVRLRSSGLRSEDRTDMFGGLETVCRHIIKDDVLKGLCSISLNDMQNLF